MKNKTLVFSVTLFLAILGIGSCTIHYFRSNYKDANTLLHETQNGPTKLYLKAHLKNGQVCILKDSWNVDTVSNNVSGIGTKYDFNRNVLIQGNLIIPIDSIAIFETNKKIHKDESGRLKALGILAAINATVTGFCLSMPKACFGSCPTFYIDENDNFHYADAEGFSNAISPSMEYFDLDALHNTEIKDGTFSILMKNEALETHCVNDVKLYACPRKTGERIFQSASNKFYLCKNNYTLSKAISNEGDITKLIQSQDRIERFSLGDESNLSSKEEIYLNFEHVNINKNLGLILDFRQSLMTTYFIYSAMGYMGNEISDIFAKIETNKEVNDKLKSGIKKELGNIDIYLWDEHKNLWTLQSGLYETGPIAINRQIVPLENLTSNTNVKVKLVLNKGLWRMDYVRLTNIVELVKPIEIPVTSILNKGNLDSTALYHIHDPKKYLISMPGNEYKFNFVLPEQNTDYELFLYTKGYYLEWMREHWIKDKDLIKLNQMVNNPKKYLKEEAANYKKYETSMEQEFWNSKINTKTFSHYEE